MPHTGLSLQPRHVLLTRIESNLEPFGPQTNPLFTEPRQLRLHSTYINNKQIPGNNSPSWSWVNFTFLLSTALPMADITNQLLHFLLTDLTMGASGSQYQLIQDVCKIKFACLLGLRLDFTCGSCYIRVTHVAQTEPGHAGISGPLGSGGHTSSAADPAQIHLGCTSRQTGVGEKRVVGGEQQRGMAELWREGGT